MKPGALIAEAGRTAWAQQIPSAFTVIVVAVMCFTALATAGRATANDQELADSLEQAGSRLLTITDSGQISVVTPALVGVANGIDGVETAVALAPATDVYPGSIKGGTLVPLWEVSDLSAISELDLGRRPWPGEATVDQRVQDALGLEYPAGFVTARNGMQTPIVSRSIVSPAFEDLAVGVLAQAVPDTSFTQLRVVIRDVSEAGQVQRAVLGLFGTVDPTDLSVDSPRALNTISELVKGQLGRYNQSLLSMILGVGALFIAIVVLADVLLHRKELGRRRALGATRSDLSVLTVVRTMIPGTVGALVGCGAAWALYAYGGTLISVSFTVAVGLLAVVASGLAAALPAAWASMRDPVSVLRTP